MTERRLGVPMIHWCIKKSNNKSCFKLVEYTTSTGPFGWCFYFPVSTSVAGEWSVKGNVRCLLRSRPFPHQTVLTWVCSISLRGFPRNLLMVVATFLSLFMMAYFSFKLLQSCITGTIYGTKVIHISLESSWFALSSQPPCRNIRWSPEKLGLSTWPPQGG